MTVLKGLESEIPREEKLMFLCEFTGDGSLPQLNSKTSDNTPRLTIHSFLKTDLSELLLIFFDH